MVLFTFSVLDAKHSFLAHMDQKDKIAGLG